MYTTAKSSILHMTWSYEELKSLLLYVILRIELKATIPRHIGCVLRKHLRKSDQLAKSLIRCTAAQADVNKIVLIKSEHRRPVFF